MNMINLSDPCTLRDPGLKGGAHSNHYRMQECTSSRPHPTTHHKPLTANDIHTILYIYTLAYKRTDQLMGGVIIRTRA